MFKVVKLRFRMSTTDLVLWNQHQWFSQKNISTVLGIVIALPADKFCNTIDQLRDAGYTSKTDLIKTVDIMEFLQNNKLTRHSKKINWAIEFIQRIIAGAAEIPPAKCYIFEIPNQVKQIRPCIFTISDETDEIVSKLIPIKLPKRKYHGRKQSNFKPKKPNRNSNQILLPEYMTKYYKSLFDVSKKEQVIIREPPKIDEDNERRLRFDEIDDENYRIMMEETPERFRPPLCYCKLVVEISDEDRYSYIYKTGLERIPEIPGEKHYRDNIYKGFWKDLELLATYPENPLFRVKIIEAPIKIEEFEENNIENNDETNVKTNENITNYSSDSSDKSEKFEDSD